MAGKMSCLDSKVVYCVIWCLKETGEFTFESTFSVVGSLADSLALLFVPVITDCSAAVIFYLSVAV